MVVGGEKQVEPGGLGGGHDGVGAIEPGIAPVGVLGIPGQGHLQIGHGQIGFFHIRGDMCEYP